MNTSTGFHFGKNSEKNLEGVDESLADVVRLALTLSSVDFSCIEGLRTKERQEKLYSQGRTTPGPVVTWTLNSKHIEGHAVDLLPINPTTGKSDWGFKDGFKEISVAMFEAAKHLGTDIRWGGDWNCNGIPGEKGETDSPHFELKGTK